MVLLSVAGMGRTWKARMINIGREMYRSVTDWESHTACTYTAMQPMQRQSREKQITF